MPKFHLVFLIHAHQPVGNFDHVFEHTFERCYSPFLECLQRHPSIRIGLHYSGPLLEWIAQRHPDFLERVRELADRGQVELVGGGFYEPILISIPPEDQVEQMGRMSAYLFERFGVNPEGAWLAERVWEPQLPSVLSECGVKYTVLDDIHFLAAGFEPEQLHGYYTAEDCGKTIRVIPGLKLLRYFVPFRSVEETLEFLHDSAARHPGGMATMGDDCEKFGGWPGTYEHCYRDGWLDRFFSAIEESSAWLAATPPSQYIAQHHALGRADLPTASYSEMMEWVLPTPSRIDLHAASEEFARRSDVTRFLRGGHWRGFFSKYAEANLLHKKMLHVSAKLHPSSASGPGVPNEPKFTQARTHLLRAQCNDAYWHGIFGGIYAPHLRTELWRELVRAETLANELNGDGSATHIERMDFDGDLADELYVTSPNAAALVRPTDGGTISAMDFRTTSVTVINSMQRRVEAYHSRIRGGLTGNSGHVATIHEQVRVKEEGLERFLRYDRWPRSSFRLMLFPPDKTFHDYQQLTLEEHAGIAGGRYSMGESSEASVALHYRSEVETPVVSAPAPNANDVICCSKCFTFSDTNAGFHIECVAELGLASQQMRNMQVGIEIVINFLAPDAPDRYFQVRDSRVPLRWSGMIAASNSDSAELLVVDEWQDVAATIAGPNVTQFWISPIETVSESEDGFERVYQGSQILALWPALSSTAWKERLTLRVEPASTVRNR